MDYAKAIRYGLFIVLFIYFLVYIVMDSAQDSKRDLMHDLSINKRDSIIRELSRDVVKKQLLIQAHLKTIEDLKRKKTIVKNIYHDKKDSIPMLAPNEVDSIIRSAIGH